MKETAGEVCAGGSPKECKNARERRQIRGLNDTVIIIYMRAGGREFGEGREDVMFMCISRRSVRGYKDL